MDEHQHAQLLLCPLGAPIMAASQSAKTQLLPVQPRCRFASSSTSNTRSDVGVPSSAISAAAQQQQAV
jgi:hypothetical protein